MLGLRGDVKGNKPIILMLSFVLFQLCPFVMKTLFQLQFKFITQ